MVECGEEGELDDVELSHTRAPRGVFWDDDLFFLLSNPFSFL